MTDVFYWLDTGRGCGGVTVRSCGGVTVRGDRVVPRFTAPIFCALFRRGMWTKHGWRWVRL